MNKDRDISLAERRHADLLAQRDRILCHPKLGPRLRRFWAVNRAKNGDVIEYVPDPVEKGVNEVLSVMDASMRVMMSNIFKEN